MKRLSPLPRKRGRIEIIPLIDIMFFLLAAFMVVSISKIKVDSLKINLPTEVPAAERETKEDFVSISINTLGQVQIDKQLIASKAELILRLQELYDANHDQKILISADRETHHGDVMAALSRIRQAGFQKIAFAIKGDAEPGAPGADSTSGGPNPDAGPDSNAPLSSPAPTTSPIPATTLPASSAAAPPAPASAPNAPAATPPAPAGN
jgi:biopolymer transport protein ExbD